jgi:hypothetical protein
VKKAEASGVVELDEDTVGKTRSDLNTWQAVSFIV